MLSSESRLTGHAAAEAAAAAAATFLGRGAGPPAGLTRRLSKPQPPGPTVRVRLGVPGQPVPRLLLRVSPDNDDGWLPACLRAGPDHGPDAHFRPRASDQSERKYSLRSNVRTTSEADKTRIRYSFLVGNPSLITSATTSAMSTMKVNGFNAAPQQEFSDLELPRQYPGMKDLFNHPAFSESNSSNKSAPVPKEAISDEAIEFIREWELKMLK